MRSVFIVGFYPFFGHFPHLFQGREEMGIQQDALVAQLTDKALSAAKRVASWRFFGGLTAIGH